MKSWSAHRGASAGGPDAVMSGVSKPPVSASGLTRRAFLASTGATTLGLFVYGKTGTPVAVAAVPGGSLNPARIPKFVTPLVVPATMPATGTVTASGKKAVSYAVALRQFRQQVLPPGLPATTVWSYGPASWPTSKFHAPGPTFECHQGTPVQVTWRNELLDSAGRFLPHLLPVDPTLHWANPERVANAAGQAVTDTRPAFTGRRYVPPARYTDPASQYTDYRGPVPISVHLHGAMGVGAESDGYPEAWFLPAASNLPAGIARHGRWWPFNAALARSRFGATWRDGSQVSWYPNDNRASTLWYHDHALGLTRLNVYAGPAGLYIIRGGDGSEDQIIDARGRRQARLPPASEEIPLVIQDRSFNADGSLFYPSSRAFFDGATEYIPGTEISPVWNPEFFGNTLIVNGHTWPYIDVQKRRYRLRLLNGCQSRALALDFASLPGALVHQIGNESGLLPAVVDLTAKVLVLAPAERADLIVDFTRCSPGRRVLRNLAPDAPYNGTLEAADPATTGQVVQFRISHKTGNDPTTPGRFLRMPAITPLPSTVTRVRRVALMEHAMDAADGPTAAMLGVVMADPAKGPAMAHPKMWSDPVTETPGVGDVEVWEVYNLTVDAHPVHVHEVAFEVMSRQRILVDEPTEGGHPTVRLDPGAPHEDADSHELGRKETVVSLPGTVTRIKAQFRVPGRFVWHCHILEHEDNEMMRQIQIGPFLPGQPD